jgi:BirA family biotin operon repressor/biotin-[acetyl-CoA-carboxylase] ligase
VIPWIYPFFIDVDNFYVMNKKINTFAASEWRPDNMIGHKIIELDSIDSTNSYAIRLLLKEQVEEGTVIWAREQLAGRGQNENRWDSDPGKNLTFTTILFPRFLDPSRQFLLNKMVSLGILDFVREFAREARIKWPNDIYIGDRKVSGILIENKIVGPLMEASFVGIGININQTRWAEDVPNPVSLIELLRHEMILREALQRVCGHLELRRSLLVAEEYALLDEDYGSCLFGLGKWMEFRIGINIFEGMITGVDDFGRLHMIDREQKPHTYLHKEIEYIIP